MSKVKITDVTIWAKHVDGQLKHRILQMNAGEVIELDIDGIVGRWEKMQNYKSDGTPTPGIKPVGSMANVWTREFYEKRKDKLANIREVQSADRYLEGLSANLSEWNSTADEEAYRDLQPR